MLWKRLEAQGVKYREWRFKFALLLAPFAAYAFIGSGWMTEAYGHIAEQRWDLFCLAVSLTGLSARFYMAGYGQVAPAGRFLPQGPFRPFGFYSLVRHPVFAANFLIQLGVVLLLKSVLFTALAVVVAVIYYERLALAKERMMLHRYGEEFAEWAARTPLIVPKFSAWKWPDIGFDFRAALRREAITFVFLGISFFTLETLEGIVIDGLPFWEWVQREPHWLGLFLVSGAIFWTQLSRIWAVAMLVLTSVALGAAQFRYSLPFYAQHSERVAVDALASGGYVLLLRHAMTTGTDRVVDVNDCSTQRVLSDSGRDQARAIAANLIEHGVKFAKVVSSQFCRARDTAKLVGQIEPETLSNLNEQQIHLTLLERIIGQSEKDEKILRPIRDAIREWNGEGNLLLVSHAGIIRNLTHDSLHMGEGLVLRPDPQSGRGFTVVGRLSQFAPAH